MFVLSHVHCSCGFLSKVNHCHVGGAFTQTVVKVLVAQLCLTLCDPMNGSSPGFSVHGILQARILEWVAIPFSRGSSQPRRLRIELESPTLQADSLSADYLCLFLSTAIFAEICSSFTESTSFLNPFLFDTKSQSHLLLIRGN